MYFKIAVIILKINRGGFFKIKNLREDDELDNVGNVRSEDFRTFFSEK